MLTQYADANHMILTGWDCATFGTQELMKAQVSDLTARLNAIERPGSGGGESRVLQTTGHTNVSLGQTDSTPV